MTIARLALIATMAGVLAVPAGAATFRLQYTTLADSLFAASTVDARLTTDGGAFYGQPGYLVTGITGTRDGVAIDGLTDPYSEVFFPGSPIVDGFGITFTVGGRDYNFYSDGGAFDHEYSYVSGEFGNDGEGRLIALGSAMLTAVPEPAAWTLMIAGFGMSGMALRRRRTITA